MSQINHLLKFLAIGLFLLLHFSSDSYAVEQVAEEQKRGWKSIINEALIAKTTGDLKNKILQYGNWYGPGYWGGSRDPNNPGSKAPVDSLDEVAMHHDFAYLIAEQQGAIYGKEEELRLKGIADKIAVDEARALPSDPRKWPNPPKGSVNYDDIKGYRDRMIAGFSLETEGYKHLATLVKIDRINNDKIGFIFDVTDQSQKFDEADLKRHVKTVAKNWKNVTGFPEAVEDSKLTDKQRKELFKKYKENPQTFQKHFTTYKKKNAIRSSDARNALNKQTAAIIKKNKIYPEDVKRFLNCMCQNCGGTLGGSHNPDFKSDIGHGPCQCSGPLTIWKTPIPDTKKYINECINQITAEHYKADQRIFDKWHQTIRDENAKSAQENIKLIDQYIGKSEFIKAVEPLKAIESLIEGYFLKTAYPNIPSGVGLDYIKNTIFTGLIRQAKEHTKDLSMEKPLASALKKVQKACTLNYSTKWCEQNLAKYEQWGKNWNTVTREEVPKIEKLLKEGKINSARTLRSFISERINKQLLPSRHHDPILVTLDKLIKEKDSEYSNIIQQSWRKIRTLNSNNDPRGVVKLIDSLLKKWEHSEMEIKSLNRSLGDATQKVRIAKENDKAGDKYKKQKRLSSAVNRYRVSLKNQKDTLVQRKLDELLKRYKKAMEYKKSGDDYLNKQKLSHAIKKYESSIRQWPDSNLQKLISQLKNQLQQQKRQAALKVKIAKLEREKKAARERASVQNDLDISSRFGDRESQRTQQIEDRHSRDAYADNTQNTSDYDKMIGKLKQDLHGLEKGKTPHFKPTPNAPISQGSSSSLLPKTEPAPSGYKGTIILSSDNIDAVTNGPKQPANFTINNNSCKINIIVNYHYNHGKGMRPGTISIKSSTGKIYGPWKPLVKNPNGSDPKRYWTVTPKITLAPGSYTLLDSHNATWATNAKSGYRGITSIYGECAKAVTGTKTAQTPSKQPVVKSPSQNSALPWNGTYTGTYRDDRNKGCKNPNGSIKLIINGYTISGDGTGHVNSSGKLNGTLSNGYNLKGSSIKFNNLIQGFLSGPTGCNAYIELRKK